MLWGFTASPYLLKMQSLLDYAGLSWERWPEQASRLGALRMGVRLTLAKRRAAVKRYPAMSQEMDEYPAVPFYSLDGRAFYYDSSALAYHLDRDRESSRLSLVPEEASLAFLCQLIDEAFDEFGLYMVHHMRWVGSARSTPMGDMTAREMRSLLPPGMQRNVAQRLCRRQVVRCPYLFSVAPKGFDAGVAAERTPKSRAGFPPTHALLDEAWRSYLSAMEELLSARSYVLGERFTLADASAYGQLGMNLVDPEACELLQKLAPRTYRWLCAIRDGEHTGSEGELAPDPVLQPLVGIISETFLPLMAQNERAFREATERGETVFNEAAFRRGRALYDGELLGHPFRSVAKTFQVRVWRELQAAWGDLDAGDRNHLATCMTPATLGHLGNE